MKRNVDLLSGFVIILGSMILLKLTIPVISPFIQFVSVILLQGWLFNELIFTKFTNLHVVLRVILIYLLGSILCTFELWILTGMRMLINQNSMVFLGNTISLMMLLLFYGKQWILKRDAVNQTTFGGLQSLLISTCIAIIFGFLIWYSIPITREPYTEFYAQEEKFTSSFNEGNLFIVNHENSTQVYRIICISMDNTIKVELLQVPVPNNSTAQVEYRVLVSNSEEDSKLRINLYISARDEAYRTIEISGNNCNDIRMINYFGK